MQIPFYQRQVAPQVQSMPRGSTQAAAAPWEALAGVGQAVQGLGEKGMALGAQIQEKIQSAEDSNNLERYTIHSSIYEKTRAGKIAELTRKGMTIEQVLADKDLTSLDTKHQEISRDLANKIQDPTKKGKLEVGMEFSSGVYLAEKTSIVFNKEKAGVLTMEKKENVYKSLANRQYDQAELSVYTGLNDGVLTGPEATPLLKAIGDQRIKDQNDDIKAMHVDLESLSQLDKSAVILKDENYRKQYPALGESDWRAMAKANKQARVDLEAKKKEGQYDLLIQTQAQIEAKVFSASQMDVLAEQDKQWNQDGDPVGLSPAMIKIINGKVKADAAATMPEDVGTAVKALPDTLAENAVNSWFIPKRFESEIELNKAIKSVQETEGLGDNHKFYAVGAMVGMYRDGIKNPDRGAVVQDSVANAFDMARRIAIQVPGQDPFKDMDTLVKRLKNKTSDAEVKAAFDSWVVEKQPLLQKAVNAEVDKARRAGGSPSATITAYGKDKTGKIISIKFSDGTTVRVD